MTRDRVLPMNRSPTSLAYRAAKWRLSQRPSRYATVLFVVLALYHLVLALCHSDNVVLNSIIATGFISSAYSEWELTGFRELLAENAAARESPPPTASGG